MEQILISACLCGFVVRYNGSAKSWKNRYLLRWHAEGRLVICCPEIAAGAAFTGGNPGQWYVPP